MSTGFLLRPIFAEAALAHSISDIVEAAYRRGDFFMKRRALMDAWAKYCESSAPEAKVLPMTKRRPADRS